MSGLRSAGWLRRCEHCGGIIWPWQCASPTAAIDLRPQLSGRALYEKIVKDLGMPDPIPFDMLPAPRRATLALLETEIAWDNRHRRTHT